MVFLCGSLLNGSQMSKKLLRNFSRYLTKAIRCCTPEISVGISISKMALIFAGSALIPSGVSRWPINLTSLKLDLNLSALNFM